MYADNTSDRPAGQPVQPLRSAQHVGRVGALAVALGVGVGVGVFGQTATAAADSNSAGSGDDSADTGRATRAPHTGVRNSTTQAGSESPAPANAVDAPAPRAAAATVEIPTVTPQTQSDSALRHTRISVRVDAPAAVTPSAPEVQTPVAAPEPTPAVTVPSAATPVIGAAANDAPVVEAPAVATAAAQQAPAMTVAEPGALASGAEDPLSALGGGSGGPGTEPLAWAAAAVARREDLAGATPEVDPAASVGTGQAVGGAAAGSDTPGIGAPAMAVYYYSSDQAGQNQITSAAQGDVIYINGVSFTVTTLVKTVKFGCVSDTECKKGVEVSVPKTDVSNTQIKVQIPLNAVTGLVQTLKPNVNAAYGKSLTITGTPQITNFAPGEVIPGGSVAIVGQNFTGTTSVKFNGVDAAFTVDTGDDITPGTQITAAVPSNVTAGKITVMTPFGTAFSDSYTVQAGATFKQPELPTCNTAFCATIGAGRYVVVNNLAKSIVKMFPTSAPAGGCNLNATCPQSPANYISSYAFSIIYALEGQLGADVVGTQVAQFFNQPDILTYISETVALRLSNFGANRPALPQPLAATIGNAAAGFLKMTLGNQQVATAFAPFLQALNLPTVQAQNVALGSALENENIGLAALLSSGTPGNANYRAYSPTNMLSALITFFQNGTVQQTMGTAFAGAVNVLLGQTQTYDPDNPDNTPEQWAGEPVVDKNALANYLGDQAASRLLGDQSDYTPALGDTISTAISNLFGDIGSIVAYDAGQAFVTFLNGPASPNVATVLAYAGVNGFVSFLDPSQIPFLGQPPLLPSLSQAGGAAITAFVGSVLGTPKVITGLGSFVNELVPGILGNVGIQDEIAGNVSALVAAKIGGDLGTEVGDQVGAAVAGLVSNPIVTEALATFLNTALGSFLTAPGVVSALANAAGTYTTGKMNGEDPTVLLPAVVASLRTNPDIDAAVGPAVTSATAGLLGNTQLWGLVDTTVTALVTEVFNDQAVQDALYDRVYDQVYKALKGGQLGQVVGDQVATAVLALLNNSTVQLAVTNFFDTIVGDFWRSPGVATAYSQAAGTLATGYVVGNLDVVKPQVEASLQANANVVAAVDNSVGAAVSQLLSDTALWQTLNTGLTSLVDSLLDDPEVQDAVYGRVYDQVYAALKGGQLGQVVGDQVATAVVSLMDNTVVQSAVHDLFDTVIVDFVGSPGVVSAFTDAADTVMLAAVTGGNVEDAVAAAGATLRANMQVQTAVENSVTAAVADLFGNQQLWQVVNADLTSLIDELLSDQVVQDAVYSRVYDQVYAALKGGQLGQVVGDQVAAAVVSLMDNPVVQSAVHELTDTVIVDFFTAPGVVEAYSDAAGEVALVAFTGGDVKQAIADQQAILQANSDVDAAVQASVGAAVTELLGNQQLWQVVNADLTSLIDEVLSDQVVQDAVYSRVYDQIYTALDGTQLGQVVGDQVATAVVSLMTNATVQSAVHELTDTVIVDFFTAPGVVEAYSDAAGEVALAAFTGGDVKQAIADQKASLQANADVDAAVQASVGAAVAELLGDQALWQVVDATVTTTVDTLLDDTTVQNAAYEYVATKVAAAIGGPLGVAVGDQVANTVVSLMDNTVVQSALHSTVDTVFQDFFGYYGVVPAFSEAAGDVALAAFTGGDVQQAIKDAKAGLQANPAVDGAVQYAVGDAVADLLGNSELWQVVNAELTSLVDGLLDDTTVQAAVYGRVYETVYTAMNGTQAGQFAGDQVATAVVSLMTNSVVQSAVNDLTDTVIVDFFNSPGVVDAVSNATGDVALVAFTGGDVKQAIDDAKAGLAANPAVDDAVQFSVGSAVTEFVGDTELWQVIGGTVDTTVTSLLGNTAVQQYAGQMVGDYVTTYLGALPIADPVGQIVGTVVGQFLATPGVASGLGTVVGSVLPDLFGQAGVPAEIGTVAGDYAFDVLTGMSQADAQKAALAALKANAVMQAGVRTTVANTLDLVDTQLLSVATIQQGLGAAVTSLVVDLAGDAEIQTYVGHRYGQPVADFLANTAAIDEIATVLGATVTDLLGYNGFSTALTDAMDVFANAVLDGDSEGTAIQDALQSLRSDPAFVSAITSIVPDSINTILSDPTVLDAAGTLAQGEAVATLQKYGINSKFLLGIVGNVANGTVESFLGKHPAQKLVDELAVNVILGKTPLSDARSFLIDGLYRPVVAVSLGLSVGHGIGTIFGDNVIGQIIGLAAGLPGTVMVAALESLYAIYQLVFGWLGKGRPAASVSPAAVFRTLTQTSQVFGGPLPAADPAASLMVTGTGLLAFKFQAA